MNRRDVGAVGLGGLAGLVVVALGRGDRVAFLGVLALAALVSGHQVMRGERRRRLLFLVGFWVPTVVVTAITGDASRPLVLGVVAAVALGALAGERRAAPERAYRLGVVRKVAFSLVAGLAVVGGAVLVGGRLVASDEVRRWVTTDCPPGTDGFRPRHCLVPGASARGYRVNRLGLYGDDVPVAKAPGELRILCVGGSTTEGDLPGGDTWPVGLQDALADAHPGPVRVLNGGVGSYTSREVAYQVERFAGPAGADLVLVYSGWNDFKCHQLTDEEERAVLAFQATDDPAALAGLDPWFAERADRLRAKRAEAAALGARWKLDLPAGAVEAIDGALSGMDLYLFLRARSAELALEVEPAAAARSPALFDAGFRARPYEANLRRAIDAARAAGATPVLVTLPHGFHVTSRVRGRACPIGVLGRDDWYAFHSGVVNPTLRRLARETGTPLADVEPLLTAAETRRFYEGSDGLHALDGGYRRIGELIAAELAPLLDSGDAGEALPAGAG